MWVDLTVYIESKNRLYVTGIRHTAEARTPIGLFSELVAIGIELGQCHEGRIYAISVDNYDLGKKGIK